MKKPKVLIYVLCYSDETETKAREVYSKYLWAKILRIKTTRDLENIFFLEMLDDLYTEDTWWDYDYVGTISWKAFKKISLENLDNQLKNMKDSEKEIMPFEPFDVKHQSMIRQAITNHKHFFDIYVTILTNLGFSIEKFISVEIPFFAFNYWMAHPCVMKEYAEFLKRVKGVLEDPSLHIYPKVNSDSGYRGDMPEEKKKKIFGKNYYTYHPFVYERMPGIFCFLYYS